MKKIFLLALAAVSLTGCWTSIFTVAPTVEPVVPPKTVYTTTVTTPSPKTTTVTTVTVTNYNTDLSFYLDLNAVAAAFAEARNVAEFEQIINSSKYMINNLDLNRDGWIDYLRVIETHRGVYHTFLIQACLGASMYQDVATLVAEHRPSALYVEVVGDRWLYGPNYIVRPVFIKRPPLWDVFGRPAYAAWSSPYYYGYWPTYYQKPKPIYLNHYQAYVRTYMTNHHYCHQCDYPKKPFYNEYSQMTQPNSHNDYAVRYPDQSFERRVTAQNAGQLREQVERQASKPEAETSSSSSTATRQTSTTTTRTASGTATPRTSTTTTTTSTRTASPASSSTSTRASSATTSSSRTSSGTATTRTSSASTTATTRQPSTSVESRVSKSGTTRTTIKSTDERGRTTTVKRESTNNTRAAASERSSSTRTTSGSTSTRSTSTETNSTRTRR